MSDGPLTDFLLARIAEDEGMAMVCEPYVSKPGAQIEVSLTKYEDNTATTTRVVPYVPSRAMAECAAKRRVIEAAWSDLDAMAFEYGQDRGEAVPEIVKIMAAVYSDHPDYDEQWRPHY